jgi:hypothetical protein
LPRVRRKFVVRLTARNGSLHEAIPRLVKTSKDGAAAAPMRCDDLSLAPGNGIAFAPYGAAARQTEF